MRLYILGPGNELLPIGAIGELCIGGDSVGPGYLNNQELTDAVFFQNPFSETPDTLYKTGDLARYRQNGVVEYLGRRDHQVKLRGFRIETGEIQSVINQHGAVVDSLVAVVKTDASEQLVAWVVAPEKALLPDADDVAGDAEDAGSQQSQRDFVAELTSLAGHYLPSHMIPAAWVLLTEFPLTPNGKVDRKALPQPAFNDAVAITEPRTDLEKTIASVWCAVLGIDRVGVEQNFFHLGGHSLLATRVAAKLTKELDRDIPVRALFEAPTIEQLAEKLFALEAETSHKPPVEPCGLDTGIPLTLAQQRLFLFEQMNPGTATNNMPAAVRLKGRVNVRAIERAVAELVRRHASLRTVFYRDENEQPRQKVLSDVPHAITVTDISQEPDAEVKAMVLAEKDRSQPFDLMQGPLFRAGVLKTGDDTFVLMINMHHIISDGVSVSIILRELMILYWSFDQGQPSPLPELPLQYADYAVWQEQYLANNVLENQFAYWDQQLAQAPAVSTFPTDHPRPVVQTTNGKSHRFQFDPGFAKQLQRYCQQQGMTPFMFMFAVWSMLLSRYARQEDLCIGIPTAGRHQPELDNIIGFFISSMVLRVDLSGNPSVAEHLARVKQVVLDGFANGDVPVEMIVERLAIERNPAYTPLVQTAFQLLVDQPLMDVEQAARQFADLDVELIETEGVTAKFDMLLTLNQGDDYLLGSVEYNTDLYDDATVATIAHQYMALAKGIMEDASHSVNHYPLYSDRELFRHLKLDKNEYEQILPLTATHRAFLMHLDLVPDTVQYSVGCCFELNRAVDPELFIRAATSVTNQFVVFKTEFHICDLPGADYAYQVIRRETRETIEVLHAEQVFGTGTPDYDTINQWIDEWVYQPYDVFNDSLMGFRLLVFPDNRAFAMARVHHIIFDGISGIAAMQKLLETYLALENGQQPPVYEDRYPEFVISNNDQIDRADTEQFWRDELALVEPLDFSRPPLFAQDNDYHVVRHVIGGDHAAQIRKYCRKQRMHASVYFRYLTVLMLNTYCRSENDFVIFEINAGRDSGHEDAIGIYYQQVPYHYEKALFDNDATPEDFYKQQKLYRKKLKGKTNISLQLQNLIIGAARIGFQYNYFHFLKPLPFGEEHHAHLNMQSSHVERTVQVFIKEYADYFSVELWYDGQVFTPLDFLPRIELLSAQLSGGDVEAVRDFDFLLPEDVEKTRHWAGEEKPLPDATVVSLFEQQVAKTPEQQAVICGKQSLTYTQLNARANQLAHWLISQGIGRSDTVAICLDRSVDMVVALYGVLKAGACYVPVEATYPQERIRHIVEDSRSKALLTQACLADRFADYNGARLLLDENTAQLNGQPEHDPGIALTGDDPIYVIYTSGSTGQPKGARVHHRGELNLQQWYVNHNQLTDSDRVLIISAFGFDLTQKNFFAPLISGGTIILPALQGYDPENCRQLIQAHNVTLLNCAPSAFYPVVEHCDGNYQPLESLRYVWLGGEPISMEVLHGWYAQCNTVLVNSYGPTECTDVVSAYKVPRDYRANDVIPIGRAIDNTRLVLLNNNNQQCPPGIVGEICISGVCVGHGYLNNETLTGEAFIDYPGVDGKLYRTGDLGRFLPTGDIEYIGRKDFQIKLRGLRIELGEIEYALRQLPGVKDGLVLVKDEQLVAYAVARGELDTQQWRQQLGEYLPDYMVPAFLITLSEWPLTPNGKIDRNALPEPDQNARRTPYVAPRNDLEEEIAKIWSQVLNVDEVGVYDNFFDLGGHSLLATQIASRIRRDLNTEVQMRDLLGEPTVAAIAEILFSRDAKADHRPPIKPCGLTADIPLSLGQQRLWFFEQVNPGSVANNMPAAVRLKGDLNLTAIKAAFMELSHRHASLRTVFYMGDDGEPKQKILADSPPLVEIVDLSSAEDQEKEVMDRVARDRTTGFDLEQGPLLRAQVLQLGEREGKQEWVLLLCMHHIISDGFSVNIMLQELTTLYYVFANQLPSPLQPLQVQYTDFAVWQRQHLQGEVLDQQLTYWDKQLAKAPKLSTFPTDKPRPKVQTTNGANFGFEFAPGFAEKLNQFCRDNGVTPFMFMFSVWSILLSRYNGQQDLCIGIPTAGRHQSELEPLIGFFINSMVLRADLSGNPSAEDYLERVKSLVLDGFANADVPVEMVLERLPLERNLSYTPLVQTAFQLLNTEKVATDDAIMQSFAGLEVEPVRGEGVSAKFDMLLTLNLGRQALQGTLEYNTDLYHKSTIQRLTDQFKRLAEAIVADKTHAVSTYELYSQADYCGLPGLQGKSVQQVLPLTTTQEAFLMNLQIHPDTLQYCVGYAYEIRRAINPDLFREALQHVTNQFAALRTEFQRCDLPGADLAYQVVLNDKPVIMTLESQVLDCAVEERQAALRPWYENWVYQPYDVWNDPLVEFKLVKVADNHYFYLFRGHHIVLDGIAGRSLLDKTLDTYLTLEAGDAAPRYEDRYPEYIFEHNDKMDKPEAESFWRDELADVEPLDFSKPPLFEDDGQYHVLYHGLSEEKTRQIKQYCRKQRIHPSIYFRYLAAVMLTSYCRPEKDFVVYEIQSGRSSGHEDALGVYYQQVPFHYEKSLFEKTAAPGDFYDQQKVYRKKIRGKTDVSLELQDLIAGHGRIGFQYNYFNFIQDVPFGELSATPDVQSSHVEDTVQVFIKEFDHTFNLELWYDGSVFLPLDFLPRMEQLSDQLCAGEITQFRDFDLLLAEEKSRYVQWQGEQKALPGYDSVVDWFDRQVARTPEATAVICGDESLSYLALNERANQLAHWLQANGVAPGARVAICLDRSANMLVSLWAVLKAGACYVPVEAGYPQERIRYMVEDAGVSAVITQACLVSRFSDYNGAILSVDEAASELNRQPVANLNLSIAGNDPMYVIYTSGSTGQPKGAQVIHRSELNLQQWYIDHNSLSGTDRALIISAFGFDLTQKNFYAPLLSGGAVVIPDNDGYDPTAFNQLIARHQVTLLNCAPSAFYPMVEFCQGDFGPLDSLRHVWLGGEPIRMESLLDWYRQSGARLVNSYGPTECTDVVAAYEVPKAYKQGDVVPVGSAIDNTALHIINDNDQLCPPGIVGEICISGVCVGLGYVNKPDLTEAAFVDHPVATGKVYRTGDLGRYLPDGTVEYIGRKDFQVKLRGLRIELGEIESAMKAIAEVEDSLILVHNDNLVAYALVPDNTDAVDTSEWRVALRDKLPEYMIPAHIVTLPAWPLTPNGKVDRNALPEPSIEDRAAAYVAPRNAIEKSLQEIWMSVLDLEQVGVRDNFFEIGGHSILGVRIIARVDQVLGVNLQAIDLLNNQTIEKLAKVIEQQGVAGEFSPLVELQPSETGKMLFFIHPIGGDVLCYRELTAALREDIRVYGLRCRGMDLKDPPYSSLDEMVADYVEAILSVQPQGDVLLAGQSLGGVLAIAVSQALRERGVNTGAIYMLDTYAPEHLHQYFGDEVDMIQAALGIEFPDQVRELKQKNPDQWLMMLYNMMKNFGALTEDVTFERISAIYQVAFNNYSFAAQYDVPWGDLPPVYHFSAADTDNPVTARESWLNATGFDNGPFDFRSSPGDHESILRDENAGLLAAEINKLV